MMLHLRRGDVINQRDMLRRLAELQYSRNDMAFERGQFLVLGEVIDIFLPNRIKKLFEWKCLLMKSYASAYLTR